MDHGVRCTENVRNENSLQGEQSAKLLDAIDELRNLGSVTHEVSLPQIVVVGDQSSGKSSVLEALSGLSFPTNEGLCTQFATEIVLRRSNTQRTLITIRSSDLEKAEDVRNFAKQWNSADVGELGKIIEDAKRVMGLSESTRITKDVLRIEVSGPKQDHLTFVDLPGIFANAESDQSKNEPQLVLDLVNHYVKKPRTIALAVVSAKYDFQNQRILTLLQNVDQGGKRTLGVITKPDAHRDDTPDYRTIKALIENRKWPLRLGWHVVRNLSFVEKTQKLERNAVEQTFFSQDQLWRHISPSDRGAEGLKRRLSRTLQEHILQELPTILIEVDQAIDEDEQTLSGLGSERDTTEKQRLYLIKIGEKFERMMSSALAGEYRDAFFEQSEHRLRAVVMNSNEAFAEAMMFYGHKWCILPKTVVGKSESPSSSIDGPFNLERPEYLRYEQIEERVRRLHQSHRGPELPGLPQPRMVGRLFRSKSAKWHTGVKNHVSTLFEVVKKFIENLLIHVSNHETAIRLMTEHIDSELDLREKTLLNKVEELLGPYLDAEPITFQRGFLAKVATNVAANVTASNKVMHTLDDADVRTFATVIGTVEAYYKVTLDTLVDNIAVLAIEQCMLRGLETIISTSFVLQQSDERLNTLAGESADIVSRRAQLRARLADYGRARAILKTHARRSRTSEPSWRKPISTDPESDKSRDLPIPHYPTPPKSPRPAALSVHDAALSTPTKSSTSQTSSASSPSNPTPQAHSTSTSSKRLVLNF